jgi:translation initiation factor IF-3
VRPPGFSAFRDKGLTSRGESDIRRHDNTAPSKDGPKVNEAISAREMQVIDDSGENLGAMTKRDALARAAELNLDLVEISPNTVPPVCKIMDFGKYKYQAQKKANDARKKQKIIEVKEIRMRPNIDTHDYEVKMRSILRFFEEGDKVKVLMRFRGREMAHQDIGMQLLLKVRRETEPIAKVEMEPRLEGRQMVMVLSPK